MVVNILLGLVACIAFNFLFVYVIDFKENILSYENEKNRKRPIIDKKDPFDVIVTCVIISPISTVCFIILWICHIGIKICSCYEWFDAHVISKEYNFVKHQNRKLRPVIREFNKFLARN